MQLPYRGYNRLKVRLRTHSEPCLGRSATRSALLGAMDWLALGGTRGSGMWQGLAAQRRSVRSTADSDGSDSRIAASAIHSDTTSDRSEADPWSFVRRSHDRIENRGALAHALPLDAIGPAVEFPLQTNRKQF